jgi:hypothetical protein
MYEHIHGLFKALFRNMCNVIEQKFEKAHLEHTVVRPRFEQDHSECEAPLGTLMCSNPETVVGM